ncbi:FtsK/SpoIIIE family DNA translocase [Hyphomicrobium sp.]|uniref:FtsK/SpoIIIE family DNA translocase n=1 Tax=Hyphomicrobium sp. TaxID=82 RepID=UPI002D7A2B08|nr:DNA translocase FtsK 4TM domain-containing protein [Hyphomicrobium sp.]HET6388800.1 DNA translocase FtsK 4TM domain-containing protein [Hyphomicrobium sp.]
MSLDTRGLDPQRLLPQSLEDRLLGWVGRFGGAILLGSAGLIWVSLVSWSVLDPSLTHTTTAAARNFAGPVGAIISDLLFQMLGFGAVLALIAPVVWGIEMLRSERVFDGRVRLIFYPLSLLALAGALSALPVLSAWPLRHGYGGLLGDSIYRLFLNIFSSLNEERAPLAAGCVLLAAAVQTSGKAIGFEAEAIFKSVLRSLSSGFRYATSKERWEEAASLGPSLAAGAGRVRRGWFGRSSAAEADPADSYSSLDAFAGETTPTLDLNPERTARPRRDDATHAPGPLSARPHEDPHTLPHGAQGELDLPLSAGAGESLSRHSSEDDLLGPAFDFDDNIDHSSREIAQRFAPASAQARDPDLGEFDRRGAARPQAVMPPPIPQARAAPAPAPVERAAPAEKPAVTSGILAGIARARIQPQWKRPSLNMLKRPSPQKPRPELSQTVMRGNARLLEDVLADFGIKGEIKDIRPGPVVTLYELEPSRGTKSSRVIGLAEDIARSMSVASVRAAVVPGRNAIGLELPNTRRETVLLREILEADAFKSDSAALPLGLGKSISGDPVVADLARMPHLLVAGTTGSGKSVGINSMVLSLLYRHSPDDCRVLMIDPKMLELSVYNGIPHLLTPVITDPHKAVAALNWAVREMEERYKRMAALSVRNIDVFNNRVRNAKKRGEMLSRTVQTGFDKSGQARFETQKMDLEPLPRIVIIVDEFADLMIVAGREVEASVQRLAQMARAAGIHLIMATQRPSVDIITGTIKANFPTRISFKVTSKIDSRTILNEQGAEQLLGQGDMLYSTGAGQFVRVHGAFVSDEEVVAFAEALRQEASPKYVEGITDTPAQSEVQSGVREASDDDLYDRAVAIVLRDGKASTSYVQRRLSIGYNRAADLIERMEREGLISAANSVGKREILVPRGGGADAAA